MNPKVWKQKALEFTDRLELLTKNEIQTQKEEILNTSKKLAYEGWGQIDSKTYDAFYLIYVDIVCTYIYFAALLPKMFYKCDMQKKKQLILEFRKYCINEKGEY